MEAHPTVKEHSALKPQYFDLTVMDVEAARRFFEACLGWRFVPFDPIPGYYRIQAGAPDEPGMDDGIGKVEQNGGRVVEAKRAIPGIGWFCTCAEPGGLLFGVLQPHPGAT